LNLRPLQASDKNFVCKIYQDSEMMQMIGTAYSQQQSLHLFNAALNDIKLNNALYFIVESLQKKADIAFVGMQLQLSDVKSLEVGSMILKPYRSLGVAAWVQKQAFEIGKVKYGINHYIVYCDSDHQAANVCYARMGFKLIAHQSPKNKHKDKNCWHFQLPD
jgi:RimJ/RimL family protein N-acetyltransferase